MNTLKKLWVSFISNLIWWSEKAFFYPKLALTYKALDLNSFSKDRNLVVFDIGANKGQSIKFFKKVYPESIIYSLEPSLRTFKALQGNLKNMQVSGVSIFQFGLGDKSEVKDFYESILDETSSFVLPNKNSSYFKKKNKILFENSDHAFRVVPADVTTLDEFINENKIGTIDILKIDVEGFEFEVIKGACSALEKKDIKIVQFERHNNDMRSDQFPAIDSLLKSLNYFKIKEIRHPFGDFYELIYQKQ